jgi:hypothetical protein
MRALPHMVLELCWRLAGSILDMPMRTRGKQMTETFWVLERGAQYVTLNDVPTGDGGFTRRAGWTDDIKDARHWPTYDYANIVRKRLGHPFWMSDPVEHAMISPEVYADGLAQEISRLKAENEKLDPTPYRDALHDLVMLRAQDEIGCVPPPTKEQWAKAWRTAEEFFEP